MLGINLTLLIGAHKPESAPRMLTDGMESIEVTHTNRGRSGFQIVFQVGRSQKMDWKDYQLIESPLLKPFNRVIMTVTIGAKPQVLMDGIITNHQFSPGMELGDSTYTITGEDISIMMDLEEKSVEHIQEDEATIVEKLISNYAQYGLKPEIVKPPLFDRPTKNERIPTQQSTDLEYIQTLAKRFEDYVFYVTPGPTSGKSIAYWGPKIRQTQQQKALTVNMDAYSNVESINFQNDALANITIDGSVQDRKTNKIQPVKNTTSNRPSLSKEPALKTQTRVRLKQFRETGRDINQARSLAQAMIDRSIDNVTVSGELDTFIYGDFLRLGGTIGVQGVGYDYDGLYKIQRVTHKIRKGEYKQNFILTRDGLGSTVEKVQIS